MQIIIVQTTPSVVDKTAKEHNNAPTSEMEDVQPYRAEHSQDTIALRQKQESKAVDSQRTKAIRCYQA